MKFGKQFKYKFKNKTSEETLDIMVFDVDNRVEGYDISRGKIINKKDITIREFENNWSLLSQVCNLSVSGFPDISDSTIKRRIKSINGVQDVVKVNDDSEIDTFRVSTSYVVEHDYIADKIKNYFKGSRSDQNTVFIINPDY